MKFGKPVRGYVQALPRSSASAQAYALSTAGVRTIYGIEPGETRAALIATLRRGDIVAVTLLHVLAARKTSHKDKPREDLKAAIRAIEAKGASIVEIDTGLDSKDKAQRDEMIFAAFEHLASAGRAAAGRRNGRKSRGRPPRAWASDQLAVMEKHWYSLDHATNDDAIRAINRHGDFDRPVTANQVYKAMTALRGKGKGGSGRGDF